MKLGTVIGTVVASRKEPNMDALKILVVRFLNADLQETKVTAACADTVSAGPGDVVLCVSSSSARGTAATKHACVDHTIIGIVDTVSAGKSELYSKRTIMGGRE